MNRLSLKFGMLLPLVAACSTGPAPVVAPDLAQSPGAEAELAGIDSAVIEQAAGDAEQAIGTFDEATRREFYSLFGHDPLGLSRRPVNAARYEIPLEMNEQVERWVEYFTPQHDLAVHEALLTASGVTTPGPKDKTVKQK